MLSPEGLVAAATVLVVLGLLAWCLWEGRLEVPGDLAEEEEEEEGIPFMAEEGSGRCRLLCKPSALAQHLVRSLGRSAALRGGRWPWPRWPQLQMLQQLLQPPELEPVVARELLQLSDAGLVALDWLVGPWGAVGGSGGVSSPVLLLIPNAAGKVTGGLLQLGLRALERGFIPVIFNRRGHNGCPLTTPRLQPFGDPGDLREAVTYLRCRHPTASLLAVSEGSGSGLLLAYLGESGSSSRLAAAACLSPIFRGRDWFEAAMPWLYEWPLLLHLKQGLSRYAGSLAEAVDMDRLLGSHSLRELEESLFCRTRSRPTSWEVYWERNEPLRDADEAAVPVLCLCSADDPVRGPPARSLPMELFRSSPYFFLLLTPRGGHCGFPRRAPGRCWGHEAVLEYFRAMAEFLRTEERRKGQPRPRRWGGPAVEPPVFTWQRSYTR
ncbi:PREDICTED: protein ABHD15 isoform X1 [Lepidothrix coronata]|uniref:Protein ABHD15 n=1 Tax=Lepidothrix coronata TaxID=321398 RepID=A0A6J0IMU8_9PASS|nr:PREDICTED: protein ABHD15 isoform X1 [Lepidothrix coronata]